MAAPARDRAVEGRRALKARPAHRPDGHRAVRAVQQEAGARVRAAGDAAGHPAGDGPVGLRRGDVAKGVQRPEGELPAAAPKQPEEAVASDGQRPRRPGPVGAEARRGGVRAGGGDGPDGGLAVAGALPLKPGKAVEADAEGGDVPAGEGMVLDVLFSPEFARPCACRELPCGVGG